MATDEQSKRALQRLRKWKKLSPLTKLTGKGDVKEVLFQNIINHNISALGIKSTALYPVSSAANYSLLYCILRTIDETDCRNILEIGVGQTSLLLDSMVKAVPDLRVSSVESDSAWAGRMRRRVGHDVRHCPLESRSIFGRRVQAFSGIAGLAGAEFDLAIVDGPVGTPRYSRWASLEVLLDGLADEFVVVFDDAERRGEQDTIEKFLELIDKPVRVHPIFSTKCQLLVFTERYRHLQVF